MTGCGHVDESSGPELHSHTVCSGSVCQIPNARVRMLVLLDDRPADSLQNLGMRFELDMTADMTQRYGVPGKGVAVGHHLRVWSPDVKS